MKALILVLALIVPSAFAGVRPTMDEAACAEHVPYGTPSTERTDTAIICRVGYKLQHDNKAKIPMWVAYSLTPARAVGCFPRTNDWDADPSLPDDKRAHPKDYAKSGYDIGHMANNGDMRWDPLVELESNVLSNAAPQLPALNRGPWRQLEDQTRAWVMYRRNPILVYVGPIYNRQAPQTIGAGRVVVPDAFWKILVDQTTHEVVAFIYPAETKSGPPAQFKTSVAEIQRKTGLIVPLPEKRRLSTQLWPSPKKTTRTDRSAVCALPSQR